MRSSILIVALLVSLPAAAQPAPYPDDLPLVWPATVTRSSPTSKRPWKAVAVEAIVPRRLQSNQLVTVVPLARTAPGDRAVATVKAQEGVPGFPATYLVTVDGGGRALLEARAEPGHTDARPFEALIVAPAHPKARLLKGAKDLPSGTGASAATLTAALDLDADGKADAALFRYCCEKPATAPVRTDRAPCSPECEAIYVRARDGAWTAVRQASDD
jgi:hypothetical protein